jgi:hypothetical protein
MAYADGCTIDEMTEAVKTADKPESEQSPEAVKTLVKLSKTDMLEQMLSGDEGRAARIAAILDRDEKSLARQSEDEADDGGEYRDFDVDYFFCLPRTLGKCTKLSRNHKYHIQGISKQRANCNFAIINNKYIHTT